MDGISSVKCFSLLHYINSTESEGTSDGSDGNTSGVRLYFSCGIFSSKNVSVLMFNGQILQLWYTLYQADKIRRKRMHLGTPPTGETCFPYFTYFGNEWLNSFECFNYIDKESGKL